MLIRTQIIYFKCLSLNTFRGMVNKNKTIGIEPHFRVISPQKEGIFLIQKS